MSLADQVDMLVGIYGDVKATTCLWQGECWSALGIAWCCSSLYQDCEDLDVEPGLCMSWEVSIGSPGRSRPSSAQLPQHLFHPIKQRNMYPIY